MKRKRILLSVLLTLGLLVTLTAVLVQAQEPAPPDEPLAADANLDDGIPIQGRLTDASGNPLADGSYDITFSLYSTENGGTPLCTDIDAVTVTDGLFSAKMDYCDSSDINGRQLWLGIKVESDAEMTPRKPIYAVPYARSLRPGARIDASIDNNPLLYLYNSSTHSDGNALYGLASGGIGVVGSSVGNAGVFGSSLAGPGVRANSGAGPALALEGTGTITSTAKSYIWISGNDVRPWHESDSTVIDMDTIGGAKVYRGSSTSDKNIMLPVTVPGVLYGQDVTISGLDIYYLSDSTFSGIEAVLLRRQTGVCGTASCYKNILSDHTSRNCDDDVNHTGCTIHFGSTNLTNNVLDDDSGILYLTIQLTFDSSSTSWVEIGGARLTLEHK